MDQSIRPFKVDIPQPDLDLLQRKLELTRLPPHDYDWTEENGITTAFLQDVLTFWREGYSWRDEEARINAELPQFTTKIQPAGFEDLDVHFVHSCATGPRVRQDGGDKKRDELEPVPVLFVHGWPGSFLEIAKGLPLLNRAGYHVVAPSLPGYGFSSYTRRRGFDHRQHAEVMDLLMQRLGYGSYVIQGGDWGSGIVHMMAVMFPERVKAVHRNMMHTPNFKFPDPQPTYTPHEQRGLDRGYNYFIAKNAAYSQIQAQRPLTLGHAMHDSPIGLLSYIADKLITWSDAYPWTPTELITWTLMHYFPGPTTGFLMYHENNPSAQSVEGSYADKYITVPSGFTSLPKEILMMPRVYAEKISNCVFYREHEKGGHFGMYEVPEIMVGDMLDFYGAVWKD